MSNRTRTKEMKIRRGTKVRFSKASGNPTMVCTIAGHESHNGMTFYRLVEFGGLFLKNSLMNLSDKEF